MLIYLAAVGPQVFPELTLWGRSTYKILTAQFSRQLSSLAWQMFDLWFSIHWGHSRSSVRYVDTALLIQSILGFCKFIITHYDFTCFYFTPKVVHLWKQHSTTHYVNDLNELPGIYIWCSIFFQITASTPIWDYIVHLKWCKTLQAFTKCFSLVLKKIHSQIFIRN